MEKPTTKLSDLLAQMPKSREITSSELPNIDLYIDQITTLMSAGLNQGSRGGKALTRTMVNNYSKEGLLKQIKGKKYSKEHILIMELIRSLKQTLSISDIKSLLDAVDEHISLDKHRYHPGSVEEIYDSFLAIRRWEQGEFMELTKRYEKQFETDLCCKADFLYGVLYLTSLAQMATESAEFLIDGYRRSHGDHDNSLDR